MAYNAPQKITDPMPMSCHDDDRQWINSKLNYCCDLKERMAVCKNYTKAFDEILNGDLSEHRAVNAARASANARLRNYIAKKFKVFN